jgi:hypothetical protein
LMKNFLEFTGGQRSRGGSGSVGANHAVSA